MALDDRDQLKRDVLALIDRLSHGAADAAARDALLVRLLLWQAQHVPPYQRLVTHRNVGPKTPLDAWPALPTDVFRFARVAAHPAEKDVRVFLTSGTTSGRRGAHPQRDLAPYLAAARAGARALFPDGRKAVIISLIPHEQEAMQSSLSFMATRFSEWFGDGRTVWGFHEGALDHDRIMTALDAVQAQNVPVTILATSFALAFFETAADTRRWHLAEGSRVMFTGGFKGKTKEVSAEQQRASLADRWALPFSALVGEYGMTELSSQGWAVGEDLVYEVPGWVRVTACHPETLAPLPVGQEGLLRIDDLANVDTAAAIQTADRAICQDDQRFILLGRAPGAVPRGCSLAIEEALS